MQSCIIDMNASSISLRQLRVFRAVAAHRNFTHAGREVALSQPAVSRAIGELESQLGAKLLARTTREVELTEAGRRLAARLDDVLDELDAVLAEARGKAGARRGRVRVASVPTLSVSLMPEFIARGRAERPGLDLVMLDRVQTEALAAVLAGEADFGVVIDPKLGDELYREPLLSEPFHLVLPASHALAGRRQVRWSALRDQPLVLLDHSSGSRRLIDEALRGQGVAARVDHEVAQPTTVFRLVEAGLGVSVMPGLSITPGLLGDRLVTRPLLPKVERTVMLVRRRHRALSPAAQAAWDLLKASASAPRTAR